MRVLDKRLLETLSEELKSLCSDMVEAEATFLKQQLTLLEAHRPCAQNLIHYLALRRRDIRELQTQLTSLGLSSLGRAESHVFSTVQTVLRALNALLEIEGFLPNPKERLVDAEEGAKLLKANTDGLLGPAPLSRNVRIMVTMSSDAATDFDLVRHLLQEGMDCMRINCAHDGPEVWLGMIHNLAKAREDTGRSCRVLMDLAGPKLRTGQIEPGAAVIKCRPRRDVYGRAVTPA